MQVDLILINFLRSCQEEVTNCDKVISQLSDKAGASKEVCRKINAVKMKKDNKVSLIMGVCLLESYLISVYFTCKCILIVSNDF